MKEVVWVMGASASGKETFIRRVLADTQIAKQLGWSGRAVAVCETSLGYIGQHEGDSIVERREEILSEVQTLLRSADVVLIKWQYADSAASRPERLRETLPDIRHRIIELQAPLSELMERLKTKPWWHDIGNEERCIQRSLKVAFDVAENLKLNFETVELDSSEGGSYKLAQPQL